MRNQFHISKAVIIYCLLLFSSIQTAVAQNQAKADSLKHLLTKSDTSSNTTKMAVYAKISALSSKPDEVLRYSDLLLNLATKEEQPTYIIEAYQAKGVAFRLMGNLKMALKNLFLSADMANKCNKHKLLTYAYLEIANTYTANKDFKNAVFYNKKAIKTIRLQGNKEQLAINLLNTGYNYYILHELDSALSLYNEAEPLFNEINLAVGKAYTTGNRALVYWKQGHYQNAEENLLKALKMLIPLEDHFALADYSTQLGRLYAERGKLTQALEQAKKAYDIGKSMAMKEQIKDASLLLSELYKAKGDYRQAFDYQNQYITYKDSIENTETTKQIANLRTEFEVSQKEKEIALLEKQQLQNRIYMIVVVFLLGFAVLALLYFRQRFLNTRLMAAQEQQQHNENINALLIAQETKALESMVQGQETERKRLAQELHNHFGSLMATIKVNLNAIDEQAISNHHTLITLVDQACTDIRNLSHALNMGISDNFGLVPALKELTAHLSQANGMEVEFSAAMCREQLGSENEIIIYRIVQELVSNILRHAEATKLSILLTCFEEENLINILVQDNGKGFNVSKEQRSGSGMGLKSLRKMIQDKQGEIRFDSNPVSGTTVNIDLFFTPVTLN